MTPSILLTMRSLSQIISPIKEIADLIKGQSNLKIQIIKMDIKVKILKIQMIKEIKNKVLMIKLRIKKVLKIKMNLIK